MSAAVIPNRPVFRAQEVCEIADVQPYVLRSWEAEFPDLGVAKTAAGQRMYRRADVEKVLRLKHLLFVDGLTLAGARKQLLQEGGPPATETIDDSDVAALLDEEARQSLRDLRGGLQWILGVLSGQGADADRFVLRAQPAAKASSARKVPAPSRGKAAKRPGKRRR